MRCVLFLKRQLPKANMKASRQHSSSRPCYKTPCVFLHLLRFLLLFIVFVIVVFVLFILFVIRCLFAVILLLFLGSLNLTESLPFLSKCVSLRFVIGDNDIVKNGSTLDLPQIETEESEIIKLVNGVVVLVLGVCNFLGFPNTLVR